jgi:ATP-binding cassette subfamily C protein CydD
MTLRPRLWGEPLEPRVILAGGGAVLVTVTQRLVYPVAALLATSARAELAFVVMVAALGLAVIRAAVVELAVSRLRLHLYARLGAAIRGFPALPPAELPPLEQLGPQLARGLPWVESYLCHTLPMLVGNTLAVPIIAALAVQVVGGVPVAMAAGALCAAGVASALLARAARQASAVSWSGYQQISSLIDRGLRGRLELRAHGTAGAHEAELHVRVGHWARLDARARRIRALTGWSIPVFALAGSALVARGFGYDITPWLRGMLTRPAREAVTGGLLLVGSLPVLFGLSRALANTMHERTYLQTLAPLMNVSRAPLPNPVRSDGEVGKVVLDGTRLTYPRAANARPAVVCADLLWRPGESLALVGPNGCGKTTVALAVMGLMQPQQGRCEVQIDGVWRPTDALLGRVSYLSQTSYFDHSESVRASFRFVAPSASEDQIRGLLERLWTKGNVDDLLQRQVSGLSSGERRLIALARVLLRDAPLVVLDEPEANLDMEAAAAAVAVLKEAARTRRLLILTHDARFAAIADRVLEFGVDRCLRDPLIGAAEAPTEGVGRHVKAS